MVDTAGLVAAFSRFEAEGAVDDGGVLVQEAVTGTFVMAQCVFDAGTLVAFHAVERTEEGANGSASAKSSVAMPRLRRDMAHLGEALRWHGGLSVDAIVTERRPFVVDVNARLVEPANALAAGTDLVATFLAVATGTSVAPAPPSLVGVRTHQFLMAVLGTAQRSGRRRAVLAEVARAGMRHGVYAASVEELLPTHRDWRTVTPTISAIVLMLIKPGLWRLFTDGAVSRYALAPAGWRALRQLAPLDGLSPASA